MTLLLVFVNDIFWKGKKFSCLYYFHTFLLSMYFRPCQIQLFLCGKYLFVFFYIVPVFLFLAYIPFTGFLWFPLESFSSFLKKPYYFFSRTFVGTEPSQAFHDGTMLILPSLVKDALSGHRSVLSCSLLHARGAIPLSSCSHCFCGNVSHWWLCPSFLSAPSGAFLFVSGSEQLSCDASGCLPVAAAWDARCFVYLWLEPDDQVEEILGIL